MGVNRYDGSQWVGAEVTNGQGTQRPVYRYDGSQWVKIYPSDNIVVEFLGSTFTTGDGTWSDQATSDGSQDATINGDPQSTTLSDGSDAVAFDGTGDYGVHSLPIESSGLNTFSVEVAVQWTSADDRAYIFGLRDGNQILRMRPNFSNGTSVGDLTINLFDPDLDNRTVATSGLSLNDGNRHNITLIMSDASAGNFDLIIDGNSVGTMSNTGTLDNLTNWNYDMAIAAQNVDGTIQEYFDGEIGGIRWHDTAITNPTIDQY